MTLEVTNLKRSFVIKRENKRVALPDPNPEFSLEEVMRFYAGQYPEITTSAIAAPVIESDVAVYEFKTTVGTKG